MFQQILEKIATGLDQRGLAYMVIGGQAVLLYGEPRLTRDIDVTGSGYIVSDMARLYSAIYHLVII